MGHMKKRMMPNGAKKEKQKKRRFMWTAQLHKRFVSAIFDHGVKAATPKLLHELMGPTSEELTTDHIKSHLQKYRLHMQTSRAKFMAEYERAAAGVGPADDDEVAPECSMAYPLSAPMTPMGEPAPSLPDTDISSASGPVDVPESRELSETGELLRTVHEQHETIKKLTSMIHASMSYSGTAFPMAMSHRSVYGMTPLPSPVSCTGLHPSPMMPMAVAGPPKAPPVPASLLQEWRGGHAEAEEDLFGDLFAPDHDGYPLSL